MKTLTPLLLIVLCNPVSGRIGETYKQCVQRYGNPTYPELKRLKGQHQFMKNSFMILVRIGDYHTISSQDLSKPRIWTSTAGSKIEASVVGTNLNAGTVNLKAVDGRDLNIPMGLLEQADRELLKKWHAAKTENKVGCISYSKTELTSLGGARTVELKDEEINLLMRANSAQDWIKDNESPHSWVIKNADGSTRLYAKYFADNSMLVIFTPEWQAGTAKENSTEIQKGVEGL
jgi:hypothetical protein